MKKLLYVILFVIVIMLVGCKDNNVEELEGNYIPLENVSYKCVGETSTGCYVFELVSTEEMATQDGELAVDTLINELEDKPFIVCVIDGNEKFLGEGSNSGYAPYVFNKNDDSYFDPFFYYFVKYFSDIEYNGYESDDGLMIGGRREYRFDINTLNVEQKEKCKMAIEKIRKLMNLTLGDDVNIEIKAFSETENEICVQTYGG